MDGEEWRPVVGFEEFYEVSNLGRIKTVARIVFCGHCYRKVTERIIN